MLSTKLHCKVALIWRRIADGMAFNKTRDTREDPRAFHVECWTRDKTVVIDGLQALYGSKAKTYPLGVRLQYVASLKPTKLAAAVKNLNGSQNSRLRREINEIQERIHLTEAAVNAY
jgi:hypothetical protein